jgi:hypothetical protein
VDNELDWSLVYPELATGVKGPARPKAEAVSDSAECYPKIAMLKMLKLMVN